MVTINTTPISGVLEIIPERYVDHRGFFSETYSDRRLAEHGVHETFVQDNHSHSRFKGVLRGLHFQREPYAQAKLIWVTSGSIFDVAVDIRKGSPTYGKWFGLEISAAKGNQIFVPRGFAHGFVTLEENTDIFYKVSNHYMREEERAIRYDDPEIGVDWPLGLDNLVVSDKDKDAYLLSDVDNNHVYTGGE